MKKYVTLLVMVVVSLSCDTNDDAFYNEKYVESPDLVVIQTQPTYVVGDHIYILGSVFNLMQESGQSLPLDIRKTTNNADRLEFSYALEKKSGAIWEPVNLPNSEIIIERGSIVNAMPIIYASATYDASLEQYTSYVGLPLQSAGEYRISFATTAKSPTIVELRSDSAEKDLTLTIGSKVSQLGTDGFYNFVVTP